MASKVTVSTYRLDDGLVLHPERYTAREGTAEGNRVPLRRSPALRLASSSS